MLAPPTLRVLLCRHGETQENVARVTQGHAPGALTAAGRAQAAALGARLATQPFAALYCSDLHRAVDTLRAVTDACAAHPPPRLLPLLRERSAGVFEGTPLGTVDAAAVAAGEPPRRFRPAGGETWDDVRQRADAFLLQLVAEHLPRSSDAVQQQQVLVLTHGGFMREFIVAASQRAPPGAASMPRGRAGNTSVYTFDITRAAAADRWYCALVSANDTSHLAQLDAANGAAEQHGGE